MTTVVHHSADYDGLFCREIARKFLPDAKLVGWDFGDPPLQVPSTPLYVMDLPLDAPFGFKYKMGDARGPQHPPGLVWIDHHKSAIETHPSDIPGYRIDGVAACRLAWQWFAMVDGNTPRRGPEIGIPIRAAGLLPTIQDFKKREVNEPLAVTLAGEYDVWQHENSKGDTFAFQFGLDSENWLDYERLFSSDAYAAVLVDRGRAAQQCYKKRDAEIVVSRGFDLQFEGLNFIALNTARCNSKTFEAAVRPHHDGCFGFYWNGKTFIVSLYGVPHKPGVDLSQIAVRHGGGGHKQACGFQMAKLPFII